MDINIFLKRRHELFAQELGMQEKTLKHHITWWMVRLGIAGMIILFTILLILSRPPRQFPVGQRITIDVGSSLSEIADTLVSKKIIRSRNAFITVSSFLGTASRLQAGDYKFDKSLGLLSVMRALASGEHGDVSIRFTILESSTIVDIARNVSAVVDGINEDVFIDTALPFNGYLFPDTYFVLPSATEKEIIEMMHDRFSVVLNEVGSDRLGSLSAQELRDIVIMASILEREAAGFEDAYIISGILWKRIKIGMPLQVDASFSYLFGKKSSELTFDDLNYNSPYNTYINKGLPPGPLGNPGKIALDAALHPAESPYLYYLHDGEGGAHYGKTHDEHVDNKNKYLR